MDSLRRCQPLDDTAGTTMHTSLRNESEMNAMAEYQATETNLSNLLLDPNNYRFQDLDDFTPAAAHRFHEDTVQSRAFERLRAEALQELKNSILKNGYLPVERVIVRPYEAQDGKFVVLEGNRRVAALRWIQRDHESGVEVPQAVLDAISAVPILIATDMTGGSADYLALMGIRHVSGIRRWGGYQEAKLVFDLRTGGMDPGDIADRLALRVQEVNRRLRAFKALRQMQEDEEFADVADPSMYAIFHEAVSLPILREWIGWDAQAEAFMSGERLHQFYSLLSETSTTDGEEPLPPKITTYSQIRELRYIIPDESARDALFDPALTFTEAAALAHQDRLVAAWKSEMAEAAKALEKLPVHVVRDMSDEDADQLSGLQDRINETLESRAKLRS